MDVLLNSSSFSENVINVANADNVLTDFVIKLSYLSNIYSNIYEEEYFRIYAEHDIFTNDKFLSSDHSIKELAEKITSSDARRIFLATFTNHKSIRKIEEVSASSIIKNTNKIIRNYKEFKKLADIHIVLSFSTHDCFFDSSLSIDGEDVFNIPSMTFLDNLKHIQRVKDFYGFFSLNYTFKKEDSFDCFDQYGIMNFFFENQDNYKKISRILTEDQNRRLEIHPLIGDFFANINGFKFDNNITKKVVSNSKRRIYKKNKILLSLDFQHLEFEKHNLLGIHLGSISMFDRKKKDADVVKHSLKFK